MVVPLHDAFDCRSLDLPRILSRSEIGKLNPDPQLALVQRPSSHLKRDWMIAQIADTSAHFLGAQHDAHTLLDRRVGTRERSRILAPRAKAEPVNRQSGDDEENDCLHACVTSLLFSAVREFWPDSMCLPNPLKLLVEAALRDYRLCRIRSPCNI